MPSVAKTSHRQIVTAARRLIARHGLAELSMQAVASAVGVQAPSLYKHVPDRATLVREVVRSVMAEMQAQLTAAAVTGDPLADLRAMAHAQRAYAQRSPRLYALVFADAGAGAEIEPAEYAQVVSLLLERLRQIGDPKRALSGARLLVAYLHGFVSMEAAGAFHLSGDLDRDFAFGVDRLLEALRR